MPHPWPVEVTPLSPVSCGTTLWRMDGLLRVTIVVKATFGLVTDGPARLIAPEEIVTRDRHHDKNPASSVEAASEVAPYLPRAGVVLVGHAYAPAGQRVPALSARLSIFREAILIDKTVHVFGDRDVSAPSQPKPFQRVPLRWEHAVAGPTNPAGVAAASGTLPNLVDPVDPARPACFAPIAESWPTRRRLIDASARAQLYAAVPDLGASFPFGYFQPAPPDQQLDSIEGDEWIVLDGMTPALPRLRTRLPSAQGAARAGLAGALQPVDLAADQLIIDVDRLVCSVIWRGHLVVGEGAEAPAGLCIYAGVELGGRPLPWPSLSAPAIATPSAPAAPSAPVSTPRPAPLPDPELDFDEDTTEAGSTSVLSLADLHAHAAKQVTPFSPSSPASAGPPSAPVPSGFPFRAPELPAPAPPEPVLQPPPPVDEPAFGERRTALLSKDELLAQVSKEIAPFEIAAPGSVPARPSQPLPGTPWGPEATPAPIDETGEQAHTMEIRRKPAAAPPAAAAPPPPPPGVIEPPPRKGEMIPSTTSGPLRIATTAWQLRPPQDSLTVIVKGTFELVPDAPARPVDEPDLPMGDLHLDDDAEKSLAYASDFAILKPKADVTLTGRAHAPGGSAPAMQVVFRFGSGKRRIDRTLYIFGERRWQKTVIALAPTEPAPFKTMPIVYERAFGGPNYDRNPVGAGHKAAPGADGVARLPNVELPNELVKGPSDSPPPAGFAPIPALWKERWSKLGTYDRRWFKSRWPYFPEDFDWTFFQSAPSAQQLEAISGDEPYEMVGLFPDRPSLSGTLPGLRARAFAQKTKAAGGGFDEIALRLDTVAFDADARKVSLVWRGLLEVSDEDAPEIQALFAMAEPMSAPPATRKEAQARYMAALAPRKPVEDSPEAETAPANDVEPPDPEANAAAAKIAEIDAAMAEREKALEEAMAAAGIPEAPAPAAPPEPAKIAETMRAAGASDEEVADMMAALAPPPPDEEAPSPAPPDLRERVIARLDAGEPFDNLDLEGADLHDLDFSGRSLAGAVLRRADLRGTSFAGAKLARAQIAEADLSGADLSGADLSGADLSRANVEKARFDKAKLTGADLHGAKGKGSSFAGAEGKKAVFAGGVWEGASFEGLAVAGADFSNANIGGCSFKGAQIPDIRLYDARGARVVFDGAAMPTARAEGAAIQRSSFRGTAAEGSVWERAILDESIFHKANFKASSFLRASCLKADFTGADLTEARLRRARLGGAIFVKTNLMMAILERADLTIADLRDANLHGAGLWKANMTAAKLDGAILTKSTLAMRQP